MSPKREQDVTIPGQGPDEKVAEEAKEAKAAEGAQQAEVAAGATGEPPKKRRRRSRAKRAAEETAAETPEAGEAKTAADGEAGAPAAAGESDAAAEEAGEPEAGAEEPEAPEAGDEDGEAPAAPAPRRKRDARDEVDPSVRVRARARYVRTSARKARLVCDHIRGKSVEEARAILAFTPRAAARDWSKVLESAVANAEHNHELIGDELRIADIAADEGPTLKRYRPRAMGRATRIRKRTTHLSIALAPKETR